MDNEEGKIENLFILPDGKKVSKLSNLIRFMEGELKLEILRSEKDRCHGYGQKL